MNEQNNKQETNALSPDEDITIYEESVSVDRSRQKSRKVFVFYIIALFCVALALILVSYVMQAHVNSQMEALGTQLTQQTDAAAGAQARVEQLEDALETAQNDLTKAQNEIDSLEKTSAAQTEQLAALEQLWQLEKAYQQEDTEDAQAIIAALDEKYTRAVLTDSEKQPFTGEAAAEYAEICEQLDN